MTIDSIEKLSSDPYLDLFNSFRDSLGDEEKKHVDKLLRLKYKRKEDLMKIFVIGYYCGKAPVIVGKDIRGKRFVKEYSWEHIISSYMSFRNWANGNNNKMIEFVNVVYDGLSIRNGLGKEYIELVDFFEKFGGSNRKKLCIVCSCENLRVLFGYLPMLSSFNKRGSDSTDMIDVKLDELGITSQERKKNGQLLGEMRQLREIIYRIINLYPNYKKKCDQLGDMSRLFKSKEPQVNDRYILVGTNEGTLYLEPGTNSYITGDGEIKPAADLRIK